MAAITPGINVFPIKKEENLDNVTRYTLYVVTALMIGVFAIGVIAFTNAFPPTTVGIPLLATSGAFAAIVVFGWFRKSESESKNDWKTNAALIVLVVTPLIAGILGITGQISGTTMGCMTHSYWFGLVGSAWCFVIFNSIRKCYRMWDTSPEFIARKLAEDSRLRPYFQSFENRNSANKSELIAAFKRVLAEDQEFARQSQLQINEHFNMNDFIKAWHENFVIYNALDTFFAKHDKHLKFPFEYAVEEFNVRNNRQISGVL